jgi:hypothetical protein
MIAVIGVARVEADSPPQTYNIGSVGENRRNKKSGCQKYIEQRKQRAHRDDECPSEWRIESYFHV